MLQTSRVVDMEVTHDHGFHVFNVVARFLDRIGQFVVFLVNDSREDVGQGWSPLLQIMSELIPTLRPDLALPRQCSPRSSLEQQQAHVWMIDQDRSCDEISSFVLRILRR